MERSEGERTEASARRPVLWFEVEDFFRHFDWISQPGGIHRVCFEIFRAAREVAGEAVDIRFCRISSFTGRVHSVEFERLKKNYEGKGLEVRQSAGPGWLIADAIFIVRIVCFFWRRAAACLRDWTVLGARPDFRKGDVLLAAGLTLEPRYVRRIGALKRDFGISFALLVHDIFPITHPQFVPKGFAAHFRDWFKTILPLADRVFVASRYCRTEILSWCERNDTRPPAIEVVRFGDGFAAMNKTSSGVAAPSRPYVLSVSTIHARKNHRLLLRLWRRLITEHGRDRVPDLVWVGDRGWFTTELFGELRASRYLDGKVVVISQASDATLAEIYRNCLFTVYPSLCEGWGLPIAESLCFGKFCIASNRTSLPEVAGPLIDYFDPDDEEQALLAVERAILDPDYLQSRTERLRRDYQPATWADCARAMIRLSST